jgi:hypothetical protein
MSEKHESPRKERWREAVWWIALIVLMGGLLALATVVNAE